MTILMLEECIRNFADTKEISQTDDSKYGVFFHDYAADNSFCVTIYKCNELDSQLDLCHEEPGRIHIEQIRVNETKQRQGTGTIFFELLLQVIKCLNSSGVLMKNERIRAIDGDLCPYEYPLDQYNKSIPFYKKMAEKNGLGFTLYECDDLRNLYVVAEDVYIDLISREPEGAFKFKLF